LPAAPAVTDLGRDRGRNAKVIDCLDEITGFEVAQSTVARYRWKDKKVDRRDAVGMVAQKCAPALRWWPRVAAHIELEQFTMNVWGCPYSKLRKPKKSWSFSGIQSFEGQAAKGRRNVMSCDP
jgi:hypothetical protein